MTLRKNVFTLCLLFFVAESHATAAMAPKEQAIKQHLTTFMQEHHVPGVAVSMFINGVSHDVYLGFADDAKKQPVAAETIFELGSISKVMTSLVLAQQIDVNRLQLDTKVNKYLPDTVTAFGDISVKHLATHTSGLAFSAQQPIKTTEELHNYLASWHADSAPGKKWTYSNLGIGLLGYLLQNESHQSLDQLYRTKIAQPLGMQTLGVNLTKAQLPYVAQGYDTKNQPVPLTTMSVLAGGYAVKSSAADMQRFLRAAIGMPGTPSSVFYPMRLTQTAFYHLPNRMQGMGWDIYPIPYRYATLINAPTNLLTSTTAEEVVDQPKFFDDTLIEKTGMTNGFRAYIAVIPNRKAGIVILCNKSMADDGIVKLGRELLLTMS